MLSVEADMLDVDICPPDIPGMLDDTGGVMLGIPIGMLIPPGKGGP